MAECINLMIRSKRSQILPVIILSHFQYSSLKGFFAKFSNIKLTTLVRTSCSLLDKNYANIYFTCNLFENSFTRFFFALNLMFNICN